MHLNFKCAACESEIQAEYQYIGEWVECPICSFVQVVPDPPFPSGASYNGYEVEGMQDSSLLWTTYQAHEEGDKKRAVLLRVPTSFFLRKVSDFDTFANAAVNGGTYNIDEVPQILDKSLIHGKIYFVYEGSKNAISLYSYISNNGPMSHKDALIYMKNLCSAMTKVWEKHQTAHLNLTPLTLMIREDGGAQILDMEVSEYSLRDDGLLKQG